MLRNDDFEAAIFDLDGTLIDSNRVWEKIDRKYLQKKNIFMTDSDIRRMAAMTYEECVDVIRSKGVDTDAETLRREFNEMAVFEYRHNIFIKPNVKEYLTLLSATGKRIALATASPAELYEPVLRHNGIYSFFDAFVTTDEAGRSKDYPDVYLLAAAKLGAAPESCVVFEDVLKGIVSAQNAGMMTVAVYDKYSDDDVVTMRANADRFIMDFAEMLINL
ncbi:MAG: HAD family phosphatase [Oscillospiraceae bacterium]|nr:HAD family phosphatase [Oscillospiraceae bacterium]